MPRSSASRSAGAVVTAFISTARCLAAGLVGVRRDIARRRVHGPEPAENDLTNHLVLLVAGLPTDDNPAGDWYVDAGLGDALHEPLPLQAGTYKQAPMTFRLDETPAGLGDWHFAHDPQGSFSGMSFRSAVATMDQFAPRHEVLSTSPDSGFVKTVTVERRQQDRVSACVRCAEDPRSPVRDPR